MLYFATLFDFNYLTRGLCLIESLENQLTLDFKLLILALDENVVSFFNENIHKNVEVISLKDVESYYPELLSAKSNRTKVEYFFTLSPILPLYILETFAYCNRITTLDADIYFYSNPETIFSKFEEKDILITPHDFSAALAHLSTYGNYNVSFQSFPRTENSLLILKDWKQKCISWCYDYLDKANGRYADQKYLDSWSENFYDVKNIDLTTCGRAAWNIVESKLTIEKSIFYINNVPLIYYHFHGIRIDKKYVKHGIENYYDKKINQPIKAIYGQYILRLFHYNQKLGSSNDGFIYRYNIINKQKSKFYMMLYYGIGAIVLSSNKVLFFDVRKLKLKERAVNFLKILKWQN